MYRFALHFFVENIDLNAANAKLKYVDLTQKVNALALKAQLANMENLLGFFTTLQYRQLEYIPEVVNLKNGFVKYSLNPINETEFQQFGTPIEMIPNNDLGKAYAEYKKKIMVVKNSPLKRDIKKLISI